MAGPFFVVDRFNRLPECSIIALPKRFPEKKQMVSRTRGSPDRRSFIAGSVALAGLGGFPAIGRAQDDAIKIGLLHPMTGPMAYPGQQARAGALMAIDSLNALGGIRSLKGVKVEAVLGDTESKPETAAALVERMNAAGVAAILGPVSSDAAIASSEAAAKFGIAQVVDVAPDDQVVARGLGNTFRFAPGFSQLLDTGVENFIALNNGAGKPVQRAVVIRDQSAFSIRLAGLVQERLAARGVAIADILDHAPGAREINAVAVKTQMLQPDMIVPLNDYDSFVLLLRTLQQQRSRPKAVYSILGAGASQPRLLREAAQSAEFTMDCNHFYDPRNPVAVELKNKVEARGMFFTYELFLAHEALRLIGDAIERAATADRGAIIQALGASGWANSFMPYGPTRFSGGQNIGAMPVTTQVQKGRIELVYPVANASAKPVFPAPAARV